MRGRLWNMEHQKEELLKVLFILIWVIALTHMAAENFYLYWTFRWFDILTHFMGGIWVGLAGLWVWYYSGYIREVRRPTSRAILVALGAGFVIGILWELFELVVWILAGTGLPSNYGPDTLLDLIVDMAGALAGFGLWRFLARRFHVS
jgi:hypothetical protein